MEFIMKIMLIKIVCLVISSSHTAARSELTRGTSKRKIVSSLIGNQLYPKSSTSANVVDGQVTTILTSDAYVVDSQGRTQISKSLATMKNLVTSTACSCFSKKCKCVGLNLTSVPDYLDHSITSLDLSYNEISSLKDCSFCNYTNLSVLRLFRNSLQVLTVGSFSRLSKLQCLNLAGNKLTYNNVTFPAGVFSDLNSLTTLYLHDNTKDCETSCSYPDSTLSELTRLRTLSLDGISPFILGPKFKDLRRLRHVMFSLGMCNIDALTDETFVNVRQISTLNLKNCNILGTTVSNNTFTPLVHLNSLDVSNNSKLRVQHLFRALSHSRKNNITKLRLNSIEPFYSTSISIDYSVLIGLPQSLIHLEAKENHFETIQPGLLKNFPENLAYIDLENNNFFFDSYIRELKFLENLKVLKINRQYIKEAVSWPMNKYRFSRFSEKINNKFQDIIVQLPPKLQFLDFSGGNLKYTIKGLQFISNNSLAALKLVNNYFPSIIGPIYGLHELNYLNLKYCSILFINETFFHNFPNLKKLMLGNNKLETYFSNLGPNYTLFSKLKKLKTLDLSDNAISKMPTDILAGLTSLKVLYFEHNTLWTFNLNLSHMMNLRYVYLRHSQVNSLSEDVRQHIDSICGNRPKSCAVRFDLSFNPIHCDCENYDFLKWMMNSRAFDPKFTNYMCQYPDSSYKNITDAYEETLRILRGKCTDNSFIFLFVLAATFVMIAFVLAGIIYRFRWKLRYIYHATYLRLKSVEEENSEQFRYDVFISYAHQDEEFILKVLYPELGSRGLNVHVHGRDFVAGEFIASNIVTAVRESRKTLVVLTLDLLKSKWCNYEIQMANMESVHTGRQVLVFLLKDSLNNKQLGTELLFHIRNNTYIVYPQNDTERSREELAVFWDKLYKDLRK
ncbi:toll-like receptor 4 [Biomphalaria glabrata]|uniref:Toll-like receptor 4 n=1 Tax=Biomphalaria glabrata TaxID=6526 RepID=A0A9U8E2Z3_BIOGL|nr:toll-like receptor 4 [Biomphalaria glabrata]